MNILLLFNVQNFIFNNMKILLKNKLLITRYLIPLHIQVPLLQVQHFLIHPDPLT